ncbi:hypothetical protein [Cucumibacter marinus]|uniref:hypothetical protein n=1 Tax=Cucumibacter marinus TaxID=1121252 RepID=UPI00055F40B8|nr:hypothetical protein [Cucumibacter marinus]
MLKIFELTPVAEADDPNWDIGSGHGTIRVRAKNAGDARLVAAEAETEKAGLAGEPALRVSAESTSPFFDEKRYSVTRVDPGDYPEDGPRGLVAGDIALETMTPAKG